MSAPKMSPRQWGMLVALSVLWGGAFFFSSVALKEATPHALAFLRVAVAGLTLGTAALLLRLPFPRGWAIWGRLALLSLVSTAIPFTLIYFAQQHIASGLAAILNAMTPIFTLLVAHVATRDEKIDTQRFAGVLAGVAGVGIIVGPSAFGHVGGDLWAEAAVLGAGCCYAVGSVYGRRFKGQSPVVLSFAQMLCACVVLLPVMLIAGAPFRGGVPSLPVIGAIVALGVFGTALAFVMFFRILAQAGATNATLVTLLVPVSAILLGVLVLGESIAPRQFAGLSLIGLGLLINDGRPLVALRGAFVRLRKGPVVGGGVPTRMINEPHHSK